ncbi:MAG: FGGY-family carbohydrate kinase, partial [Parvibaculaceae bacterium]
SPRGIAVVDVGKTNSKIVLFGPDLKPVAERKMASRQRPAPPYFHLDPEPLVEFCARSLPELDSILPIDTVVPSAHGAAIACLAADGTLAMPAMDYMAEPPADIIAKYRAIEPPFSEVFGPLLPLALTHGLQLFWQETAFPEEFAKTATTLPWIQYVAFRLSGKAVNEISSISCQSQLVDVLGGGYSSLAKARGWDRLMAPMARAWDVIGELKPEFRGSSFRGRGHVLAGVHDSNANYLRYLAAGRGGFTLLSTGTWIIGFDTTTPLTALDPARDTASNTDVLGRPVACCRFFGGKEFEVMAGDVPADAASFDVLDALIARGTFSLPSFTDSGGPLPGTGNKGHFVGPEPATPAERATLASLYCALMVSQSLDAVSSQNDIIVDGPFAKNPVFLAVLAGMRPSQAVLASALRDGTTQGAAVLALMDRDGTIPKLALDLEPVAPRDIPGLAQYAQQWLALATAV